MSRVYCSLVKVKGVPLVRVDYGETHYKTFPLTVRGCRDAGRDIFESGAEEWMSSSSVDFPAETKPTFRGDVREFMSQGFRKALAEANAPRDAMVQKMLDFCTLSAEFQNKLTGPEKDAFVALVKRVGANDE